jgi:hypothetical protein
MIRPLREPISAWCEQCAAAVEMFPFEEAATLLGVTPREIYRRVEDGRLHFEKGANGSLLICISSKPW